MLILFIVMTTHDVAHRESDNELSYTPPESGSMTLSTSTPSEEFVPPLTTPKTTPTQSPSPSPEHTLEIEVDTDLVTPTATPPLSLSDEPKESSIATPQVICCMQCSFHADSELLIV